MAKEKTPPLGHHRAPLSGLYCLHRGAIYIGPAMQALSAEVPAYAEPVASRNWVGEWRCRNVACPVREVRIRSVDGPPLAEPPDQTPPTMPCPTCQRRMEFWGFLKTLTLVPAPAGGGQA